MMPNNTLDMKKKIIYIVLAVIFVVIIAAGTVFIMITINNGNKSIINKSATPTLTAQQQLDTQMTGAVQILHTDPVKSKELLLQLRQKYTDMGDTNGVVNVDAQLYYIDHATK